MTAAFAYLRKSSLPTDHKSLSPEAQEREVRALAARHGDEELTILSDMAVSGMAKSTHKRKGYLELVRAVEAGEATSVYSYSLSRLGRSTAELAHFFDLCAEHKVPVRLVADSVDTSTASGRLLANVLGSVAQFEAEVSSERVLAALAVKRARGESVSSQHDYGDLPGEDLDAVLAAWEEAGSYSKAAHLLNERGVAAKRRGMKWWGSVVRDIVRRERPDSIVPGAKRGARSGGQDFALARLLTCGVCGMILTGSRGKGRPVRYYCSGQRMVKHSRTSVVESRIMPAVQAEAERVNALWKSHKVTVEGDPLAVERLEAKRLRVGENFDDGVYDKATRDSKLAIIDAEIGKLRTKRVLRVRPFPVMTAVTDDEGTVEADSPRRVNTYLRWLFDTIHVDPATFEPTTFDWSVPELRGGRTPSHN